MPAADEMPFTSADYAAGRINSQKRREREEKIQAFKETLMGVSQERFAERSKQLVKLAAQVIVHDTFIGLANGFYVVVTPKVLMLQNARVVLRKTLSLDANFEETVALDQYGCELLGLSPWPAPPAHFGDYFVDNDVQERIANVMEMSDDRAVALPGSYGQCIWFGPKPPHITVGKSPHMADDRRLAWILDRLAKMGVNKDDLVPDEYSWLAFYEVLNGTFADETIEDTRKKCAKRLWTMFMMQCWPKDSFTLTDPRTWSSDLRSKFDLVSKGKVQEYCSAPDCNKIVRGAGIYCSDKCMPRNEVVCFECEKPLVTLTTFVKVYARDRERDFNIDQLSHLLSLRAAAELDAALCCRKECPGYNDGWVWLKDMCQACRSMKKQMDQILWLRGLGLWRTDWPKIEAELESFRQMPSQPPDEVAVKNLVCNTSGCSDPGPLTDERRAAKRHREEVADWERRMAKRLEGQ